jgi:hypothetical protein
MGNDMPAGTRRLLVRQVAGIAIGQEYVAWAVQAVCDGYDTSTLRILAGSDLGETPSAIEASVTFRSILAELRVEIPDDHALIRGYVREVAEDILKGRVPPQVGADRIHTEVLSAFSHPRDLQAWCALSGGMSPRGDRAQLAGDALDEAIRETARLWV